MIQKGYSTFCHALVIASSVLVFTPRAFARPTDPLAVGNWLEGIQTHYVSDVAFEDSNFNRYRPFRNPYAAITQALENLPADKFNDAISRYGTAIPEGISPFHSQTKSFGMPTGGLTQRAEYHFKTTCVGCPALATFYPGGLGFRFRSSSERGENKEYVNLQLDQIGKAEFEKYPYLRELLELHSLMLNARNTQSYVYQRERAIHHGMQAVLNFIQTRGIQLSPYAAKQLEQMSKVSLNSRIQNIIGRDIRTETGIDPTADHINLRRRWDDKYPFESLSGQSVLMRAIVDSVFESGAKQESANAIRENYRARRAYAAYEFNVFNLNRKNAHPGAGPLPYDVVERHLGAAPKYVAPLKWWDATERWLPSGKVSIIVPTCEGSFIKM